jgi:hypothetical protein
VSKRQDARVAEGALEDALIRWFHLNKAQAHRVLLRSDNGLIFTSKRYMKLVGKYGLEPEIHHSLLPGTERGDRTVHEDAQGGVHLAPPI